MKTVDFEFFLNHPGFALTSALLLIVVVFVPPHLTVRRWRKRKAEMQEWLSERSALVNCEKLTPCKFCGDTRVHRNVLEMLPESMNASLLATKSSGQINYVEFRCARCRSELARVAEVHCDDERTISHR